MGAAAGCKLVVFWEEMGDVGSSVIVVFRQRGRDLDMTRYLGIIYLL